MMEMPSIPLKEDVDSPNNANLAIHAKEYLSMRVSPIMKPKLVRLKIG